MICVDNLPSLFYTILPTTGDNLARSFDAPRQNQYPDKHKEMFKDVAIIPLRVTLEIIKVLFP